MSNFKPFKQAINEHLSAMSATGELFYTDVSKDELWDTYLNSFPEGTNPIYKERTEHDCNCCKQFIRAGGSIVAIVEGELVSIWDVTVDEPYQTVANTLSALVKSKAITNIYRHYEKNLGTDHNHQLLEDGSPKRWEHFHYKLPNKFVITNGTIDQLKGNTRSNKEVLERSLKEITPESIDIVLELIDQNSLYRGEEHKATLLKLQEVMIEYTQVTTSIDNYLWLKSLELGDRSKFKNTVIGTLLSDLSDEVELEVAVKKFEDKVAPHNYKRPTALITQSMINEAQKKVASLGIEEALTRRYATIDDITINNVIYADRASKKAMGAFDMLKAETSDKLPNLDKIAEVTIEGFISNILPKAESIEMFVDNSHTSNLVSLIAPIEPNAKHIFKWGNNFSWSYNGEVTDSMRENVKAAGGSISGLLRFSIQWNDEGDNSIDFDAHCTEPDGNRICYSNKTSRTSGKLDVDITNPGNKVAVENITWTKVPDGTYEFIVNNYSNRKSTKGFSAEIEYKGKIYSYVYPSSLRGKENIIVGKIKINGDSLEFIESLPTNKASKEVWGINTQKFHKVRTVMHSPNHWDGEQTGNKHWFFMLDGCINPDASRGFYNEFLSNDLQEHRKVFEVLGSKMKTKKSDNQLSGLGFSSTQTNSVICKVTGSFNRLIKINF